MTVTGIPTTRVSDSFIRDRLLRQTQFDQAELFGIQMQLSTGHRFQLPSEDPVSSLHVISLQRLLERKEQVRSNVDTNQSFLSATDSALSRVSGIASEARGLALGVMGTTSTDTQRRAAAQQIEQITKQMFDAGNQKFRGRYLFAGASTMVRPFEYVDEGFIEYRGNERRLSSYADIDLLFDSNLHGSEVFGAVSTGVSGTKLKPALHAGTRLADLHGGAGISPGTLEVAGGGNPVFVDISGAETVGDVAAKIQAEGSNLDGKWLSADVTPKGLLVELHVSDGGPAGPLTIREVGGGTTAYELGILREEASGPRIEGEPLDPMLRSTTLLGDILGTHSTAFLHMPGADNDLVIEADRNGSAINGADTNGVRVEIVHDPLVSVGDETVEFAGGALTVRIQEGATLAHHVVEAFDTFYDPETMPFTARLDPKDAVEGMGAVTLTDPASPILTDWGEGENLDTHSGLQIDNGGRQVTVGLTTAETVEDLLNAVNGKDVGLLAEINETASGIDIRSRYSGADFSIGENGGTTATQLGLRTLSEQTRLEDLNFGRGVADYEGFGDDPDSTDFTITRRDGAVLEIDLGGAETVQDVLAAINNHEDNTPNAPGVPPALVARPAAYGNGIELVDSSMGAGTLTVARTEFSTAAIDLGLVPEGAESNSDTVPGPAGAAAILTGADVNPRETEGLFTALNRLQRALETNDTREVTRAIELLDKSVLDLNFARAELGARQQGLDILKDRLDREDTDLQESLSINYDVDIVEVISDLTARQTAFEASLRSSAKIFQMTLLNYL